MKRHAIVFFTLLAFFVFGFTGWSLAQDDDDVQQGIKAYGTYQGGDIDSVSMTNGNVTVDIPLVSYPQRGQVQSRLRLVYNNKNYFKKTICIIDECTTTIALTSIFSPLAPTFDQGFGSLKQTLVQIAGTENEFSWYSLVDQDGASHILAQLSSTTDYESVDGTGLHYYQSSSADFATDADGTRPGVGGYPQEDANGNQITAAGVDTVGRNIAFNALQLQSASTSTCPSGPLPVSKASQWVGPGANGGTSTFVFCYAQVDVVKTFSYPGGETWEELNYIQSVVLPNGTAWTFQYSTDGFGDLTQITFPTGGTISYVWTSGQICSAPLAPRTLSSRTINANDGTGNHTWNYSWTGGTGPTVTDPLGNNTVYTFSATGSYCQTYIGSVNYYQGAVQAANLLKTVSTTYSATQSPFTRTGLINGVEPT